MLGLRGSTVSRLGGGLISLLPRGFQRETLFKGDAVYIELPLITDEHTAPSSSC